MDINELIQQMIEERDRIDGAIKLLSGSDSITPTKAPKATRKRKKMSAETRKKMADSQKKRWAAAKKKA
jgi:hypothetical protein